MKTDFSAIEAAIRRDPGRRGLLGATGGQLGLGDLEAAARSLAATGRHAVIATGFYIPLAEPSAAETDGPPGAVALAATLQRLGIEVTLVTDRFCIQALRAAAIAADLHAETVLALAGPEELPRLLNEARPKVSHLIAIERVGPGYTTDLIRTRFGDAAAEQFGRLTPIELQARCLNMRGMPIEEWTVDFSAAFESPGPGVTTIGLGDGGNEIGLGKFSWPDLVARLDGVADARILCRIAADHAIIGGTSNWAAYGLAAATAAAAGATAAFGDVTPDSQRRVLEAMVQGGPAVDGVTRRFEPTVDGLPLLTFLQPLHAIRNRLGLERT